MCLYVNKRQQCLEGMAVNHMMPPFQRHISAGCIAQSLKRTTRIHHIMSSNPATAMLF